jgi:hypothetical protein
VAVFGVTSSIRLWQQRTVRSAPDVTGVAIAPWLISSGAQVVWFAHGVAGEKFAGSTNERLSVRYRHVYCEPPGAISYRTTRGNGPIELLEPIQPNPLILGRVYIDRP